MDPGSPMESARPLALWPDSLRLGSSVSTVTRGAACHEGKFLDRRRDNCRCCRRISAADACRSLDANPLTRERERRGRRVIAMLPGSAADPGDRDPASGGPDGLSVPVQVQRRPVMALIPVARVRMPRRQLCSAYRSLRYTGHSVNPPSPVDVPSGLLPRERIMVSGGKGWTKKDP